MPSKVVLPPLAKISIKPASPLTDSLSQNPKAVRIPLGLAGRCLLAVSGFVLLGVFFIAYRLEPDPRGLGTHQRLGLPPCTVRALFGVRCPSCGMTTSFANFAKARWQAAARANSAGVLLALVCAAGIPWCWWSALCGRVCWLRRPDVAGVAALSILFSVGAIDWVVRLLLES